MNQAMTKYGNDIMGRELPEPECGQGIMIFGKILSDVVPAQHLEHEGS